MTPLRRIVSGGQTGADQAGLRAARAAGIETGGWGPKGWETEDGPAPWLADFGLKECEVPGYPARNEANVRDSDATIWFGTTDSPGYYATIRFCRQHGKSYLVVYDAVTTLKHVGEWLKSRRIETLNIAGNRESRNPGIGLRVETFLTRLFRRLTVLPHP